MGRAEYLWCQQQVLNGRLALIEHSGDERAMQHFARAHALIHAKYFNPAYKFWPFSGDRKMAQPHATRHGRRQALLAARGDRTADGAIKVGAVS